MSAPTDGIPYPVPILDETNRIPARFIPDVPPSDAAVAELVANPATATGAAVRAVIGDVVTPSELAAALTGYATTAQLGALATDAELATKQDRLPYDVVVYSPVTGWANPDPGPGRWRVFDSAVYVDAPSPPSRTGVNGDRWRAHPQSPARKVAAS